MARRSGREDQVTEPTTEVANPEDLAALATLAEWAEAKAQRSDEDNTQVMNQIAERIMAGKSVEDILGAGQSNTLSGENAVGRPFLCHGFRITRSGYEGQPWYANMDAEMLDSKEKLVINTGAPKVLAALHALEVNVGQWPIAMQIEAAKTSNGYEVLGLGPAQVAEGKVVGGSARPTTDAEDEAADSAELAF